MNCRTSEHLNKAKLASPSYHASATSIATSCFFPSHSASRENPFQQPCRDAAATGRFWSRKITDQCSPEAAILTHQAGYSFDLMNFVRIPRQSGQGFRFDAGHRSDLIPATIPK